KRAETIVKRHDHRALRSQVLTVVPGHTAGTAGETAAIDPDHHRTAIIGVFGAGPHVRVQAIFATGRFSRRSRGCGSWSSGRAAPASSPSARACGRARDTRSSERLRLADAIPFRSGLRRAPPVLAERRSREWNPFEGTHGRLTRADRACNQ